MLKLNRRAMSPATDEGLAQAISEGVDAGTPSDVKEAHSGSEDTGSHETADTGGTGGPPSEQDRGTANAPDDGGSSTAAPDGAAADTGGKDGDGKPAATAAKKPGESDTDPQATGADRGDGRDATGKFVKKTGAESAPGKDGAAKAAPGKPDHVNDPIPDDVKGRTRERMESLVATSKKLTTELEAARTQNDELMRAIGETGTSPEQFGNVMDALTLLNRRDEKSKRDGIAALRKLADEAAQELGDTPPGVDPLEGHADLKEDVEDGRITKERAVELAQARNRQAAGGKREQQQTEAQREQAAIETAKNELNALEAELLRSDPLYRAKRAQIEGVFRIAAETLPPAKWAAEYRRLYQAAKVAAPAQPPVRQRVPDGTGAKNPARPGQNANAGGPAAPKSLSEAIDIGIQQAGRR